MISVMSAHRSGWLLAVITAGGVAAGCGGAGGGTGAAARRQAANASRAGGSGVPAPGPAGVPAPGPGAPAIPAPPPTGLPASPSAVRVIRAWSSALRRGDVRGAARYFALPSEFINGPDANGDVPVLIIRTRAEAAAVNASLPCGAVFLSADRRGRYVNALFRLTDRPGPGGGCGSGTGQTGRTNFVITAGRIAAWIRAPDEPGDSQGPAI
jgi:hypothetical protein